MFSPLVSALVVEFIGVFMVTFVVAAASHFVGGLAPLPVGFMLASMTYSFLFVSGAHFSPVISFAMMLSQRQTLKNGLLYILVQFISTFLATIYAAFAVGVDISAPQTISLSAAWKVLLTEVAFCAAIVTIYMHNCVSRQRDNQYYGFAIGFAFAAAVICAPGGFDGAAFNPTIATSLQLTKCIKARDCMPLIGTWVHWVAPLIGAVIGVLLYGMMDTEDKPAEVDPKAAEKAAEAGNATFY